MTIADIERTALHIDALCAAVLNQPTQMDRRERLFGELATADVALFEDEQVDRARLPPELLHQAQVQAEIVRSRIELSWARAPADPTAISAIEHAIHDLQRDLLALRHAAEAARRRVVSRI